MRPVTKVLAFNGVVLGDLLEERDDVLLVRTQGGEMLAVRSLAVLERRPGLVKLICYSDGLHPWVA